MNRITCPKTSLSYSANTFKTSEERKPLYNEQNNLSQKLRYSEVPLYINHRDTKRPTTHRPPGEGLVPEGGAFLQTEEDTSNGSTERCSHTRRRSTGDKVTLVSMETTNRETRIKSHDMKHQNTS